MLFLLYSHHISLSNIHLKSMASSLRSCISLVMPEITRLPIRARPRCILIACQFELPFFGHDGPTSGPSHCGQQAFSIWLDCVVNSVIARAGGSFYFAEALFPDEGSIPWVLAFCGEILRAQTIDSFIASWPWLFGYPISLRITKQEICIKGYGLQFFGYEVRGRKL